MEEGFEFAKGFVGLALTELKSLREYVKQSSFTVLTFDLKQQPVRISYNGDNTALPVIMNCLNSYLHTILYKLSKTDS